MKPRTPIWIWLIVILITVAACLYYFTGQDPKIFSNLYFWMFMFVIAILILILGGINVMIDNQKFTELSPEEQQAYLAACKVPYFERLWKSAKHKQKDEEEKSLIIDHGFDGIMELDNSLPGWWLSLFYGCVGIAVVYMLAYATTDFAHPIKEFDKSMADAKKEDSIYWATHPDITVEQVVVNKEYFDEGKELFKQNCATCHNADGSGNAGPNLTDDYWINTPFKELAKNVFEVAWNGSPNNPTMRAFGKNKELSGVQLNKIATYIATINQDPQYDKTTANGGKAPQGNYIQDWAKGEDIIGNGKTSGNNIEINTIKVDSAKSK